MQATPEPRYRALLEAARADWWSSENFDKWKAHYIDEYERGHFVARLLAEFAPAFRLQGARVLDIGCGDAGVLIALAERGADAMGVEPSRASAERGRVRAEEHGVAVRVQQAAAERLPFAEGSFDLVLLDNVLEHVQDRDRTLAEVRRVLRPGGLFYLVTPKPLTPAAIVRDPHYGLAGLTLLPRPLQKWYFEHVRGGGAGSFDVGWIPTRGWLRRRLRRHGLRPIADPRALWVRYVAEKLTRLDRLSSPLKRRVGSAVREREWLLQNPLSRWTLDVGLGSNLFLARREP